MKTYAARFHQLAAQRDAVNAQTAPLQAQLDAANAAVQEAQDKANALAAQIQALRGGQDWLDLKRELAMLTRAMGGRIPPREETGAA